MKTRAKIIYILMTKLFYFSSRHFLKEIEKKKTANETNPQLMKPEVLRSKRSFRDFKKTFVFHRFEANAKPLLSIIRLQP